MMKQRNRLQGKKILIVDDEHDILESLKGLLYMCHVEEASSFEEAKGLIEKKDFDMAILDIMGVDGYRLLEIANQQNGSKLKSSSNGRNSDEGQCTSLIARGPWHCPCE